VIDVVRSPEPPASLATRTSWRGPDVLDRLLADFYGKCWLCEGLLERSWQVDHFRPRSMFPDLEHAWTNLLPACAICNNLRRRRWPDGGLLDPCGEDRVTERLQQWFDAEVDDLNVFFQATDAEDAAAANTADELQHVHGRHEDDGRRLRQRIHAQYSRVTDRIVDLLTERDRAGRRRHLHELRTLLAPHAPYSALLREHIRRRFAGKAFLHDLGLAATRRAP
jgi:hypothetical protein